MENREAFLLEEYKNAWEEVRQSGNQRMKYLTYYTFFVTLTLTIIYYLYISKLIEEMNLIIVFLILEIFLFLFGLLYLKIIYKIYQNFNEYLNVLNLIRYYFKKVHIKYDVTLLKDNFKEYNYHSASFMSIALICLLNSFLWTIPLFFLFDSLDKQCWLISLICLFPLIFIFQIFGCRWFLEKNNKKLEKEFEAKRSIIDIMCQSH